jgi:tRNA(fMet)-specific endonuclease VapC
MASEIICLDTSVLIDYFRKTKKEKSFFYELTQKYKFFAVSAITEFEIYFGSNPEQDLFWDEFFSQITLLPYDSDSNKKTIEIERELKQKRKQIEIPDLMIAGVAINHNMKLATLNSKHFERISGIQLITKSSISKES